MTQTLPQRDTFPPIEKRIDVPLPPIEAFRLFTEGIDRWWPVDAQKSNSGRPRRVVLEPREGGRLYGVGPDGHRTIWATVVRWEEGRALGLTWHLEPGTEDTIVLVTFAPEGDGTRVELDHGGWTARTGARRAGCRDEWTLVLCQRYASACVCVMA